MVYILGPFSNNLITAIDNAEAYREAITKWEAAVVAKPVINYSGNWFGNYGGYSFTYTVVQKGNNLTISRNLDDLVTTGVLNGNTAIVSGSNKSGSVSSTLTVINDTTVRAVVNSCVANPGYICVTPNGAQLTLTR